MAIGVTTFGRAAFAHLLAPAASVVQKRKQIHPFGMTTVSFVPGYRFGNTAKLSGFEKL